GREGHRGDVGGVADHLAQFLLRGGVVDGDGLLRGAGDEALVGRGRFLRGVLLGRVLVVERGQKSEAGEQCREHASFSLGGQSAEGGTNDTAKTNESRPGIDAGRAPTSKDRLSAIRRRLASAKIR